jgi:hypothetical protein
MEILTDVRTKDVPFVITLSFLVNLIFKYSQLGKLMTKYLSEKDLSNSDPEKDVSLFG